jgi:hypothetical protein
VETVMKLVMLGVLLVACGRGDKADPSRAEPANAQPAPTGKAVAASGDNKPGTTPTVKQPARPVEIELLHGSAAKIAVSSVVANNTIYPSDLVDGKLSTAWNSQTGDLKDAWIAFRVPATAHVTRIRMTAGFANVHGNQDWFTMNYRIKTVRVLRLGVDGDFGRHTLDPDNRGLQDIPIDGPGGDFKIELVDLIPGTKKSWREICVSELQVWGTLPANTAPRHKKPEVAVGSLDASPLPDRGITLDPLPAYGSLDAFCKEYLARPVEKFAGCSTIDDDCVANGKRACGEVAHGPIALDALPAGWTSVRYFYTQGEHAKSQRCNLAIAAGGKTYVLESFGDGTCGAAVDISGARERQMSRAASQIQGDLLAIAMTAGSVRWWSKTETVEQLWICSVAEPACSSAVQLGSYVTSEIASGPPGADGLSIEQAGWSFDWKIDGKQLVLSRHDGTVPDEQRDQLGAHRLVMPDDR